MPFCFGGRDLVPDPFTRHFAFELGEGQQHIERQPSHGGSCIKLLGDRHEGHIARVEDLDHFGEVG